MQTELLLLYSFYVFLKTIDRKALELNYLNILAAIFYISDHLYWIKYYICVLIKDLLLQIGYAIKVVEFLYLFQNETTYYLFAL